MKRYIARRALRSIAVMLLVSIIVFLAIRIGVDPVLIMATPSASEADLNALRKRYGLDKPLPMQYLIYMSRTLKGDLGKSLYHGSSVSKLLLDRLPASLELVAIAQVISLTIGLIGGVLAARSRGRWIDNLVRVFSLLGLSMPNFWVALLMLLLFSVYLGVLPTSGRGGILNLIMPASALGWYFSAGYMRLTYSSLLEVLNQEYIKFARIKGLPEVLVVGKHALRNALIPVVTLAGMNMVLMISSAVAIEAVFVWPGLGFLMYEGALNRDVNIVQGAVIAISTMMVVMNLLVDILYAYLDPRVRYS